MRLLSVKIFIFGVLLPFCSYGQNINPDYYKFGAKASVIPQELCGFNSLNKTYVFGISDPGLDSTSAICQATKRAIALAALMQNVEVKNYTTGYSSEVYRGNTSTYQSMVELHVNSSKIPNIVVTDTQFTVYNEAIIYAKINSSTDTVLYDFLFNKFNIEYQWGGYSEYSEQIEITIDDHKSPSETLVYTRYASVEEVYTSSNEEIYSFPITRYQYIQPGDSIAQIYRFGLWINIMRELNVKLGEYSKIYSEQIRKMSELHKTSDNIDEGVSKNVLSFDIKDLYFRGNQVELELNIDAIDD